MTTFHVASVWPNGQYPTFSAQIPKAVPIISGMKVIIVMFVVIMYAHAIKVLLT